MPASPASTAFCTSSKLTRPLRQATAPRQRVAPAEQHRADRLVHRVVAADVLAQHEQLAAGVEQRGGVQAAGAVEGVLARRAPGRDALSTSCGLDSRPGAPGGCRAAGRVQAHVLQRRLAAHAAGRGQVEAPFGGRVAAQARCACGPRRRWPPGRRRARPRRRRRGRRSAPPRRGSRPPAPRPRPGVRMVTASAPPSTRISSGSSTATSSRRAARARPPATRSIQVSATWGSIAIGHGDCRGYRVPATRRSNGKGPARAGPFRSWPVSRILSWTVIHLPLCGAGLTALRPTWDSAGSVVVPAWPCTGWGLPGRRVTTPPVRSYRTISPLPATGPREPRRLGGVFLWHFPAGFPGSVSRPPCPAVSGLSSNAGFLSDARDCLAGKSNGTAARRERQVRQRPLADRGRSGQREPQSPQVASRAPPCSVMRPWHTGHSAAPPACRPSQTLSSRCPSVSLRSPDGAGSRSQARALPIGDEDRRGAAAGLRTPHRVGCRRARLTLAGDRRAHVTLLSTPTTLPSTLTSLLRMGSMVGRSRAGAGRGRTP